MFDLKTASPWLTQEELDEEYRCICDCKADEADDTKCCPECAVNPPYMDVPLEPGTYWCCVCETFWQGELDTFFPALDRLPDRSA